MSRADAVRVGESLSQLLDKPLEINGHTVRVGASVGVAVYPDDATDAESLCIAAASDLPREMAGADGLLLDAKPPKDATRPGGNALPFDWGIMHGWAAPGPWLLAGGLTVQNVAEAIRVTGAPAVDVSSGVESAPGVKDPELIRAFVAEARRET